ncbi:LysR family transcriptional regulator [Frondihabitans australicus]|uniref:DNA-binding transcriptional LysR family regulator n=1 Tax=Frondihabitans australicus TaxID=386892 RepID=A0A495IL24_9MICO|nr:LysR family transcriptional regulator [Frondihabitans australicus]RKR75856.1 DNA-binding transcriptional LysR family regulator [Frondihabitans australicus]
MELRELEYFVAVAETSSFSQAARDLHVVQSGVSATIRRLEAELGSPLFDRTVHPVALTGAGTVFLPAARATLDAAREAKELVAAAADGVAGLLTIGMMRSATFIDLPRMLAELGKAHPGVEVRLRASAGGSRGLIEQILAREIDAAFLAYSGPTPAGLHLVEISRKVLHLVVSPDHPLAGAGSVVLEQLVDQSFVDSPVGYGNRTIIDDAFAAAHLTRRVSLEVPDVGTASEFIRQGIGIGFLSDDLIPNDLVVLDVSGVSLIWRLMFGTPTGRRASQPLQAFVRILENTMAPLSVADTDGLA